MAFSLHHSTWRSNALGLKVRSQWGQRSQGGALIRLASDRSRTRGAAGAAGAAGAVEAAGATAGASGAELEESVDAALRNEARAVERTISV